MQLNRHAPTRGAGPAITSHCAAVVKELLGQLLYSILGPLSYPALFLLYGSKVGLLNRGIDLSAVSQFLTWACLFSSLIATYFFDEKHEITLIEKKLAIIGLLLRNMPVATKYAYTSTPTWMELNTRYVDLQYRMQLGSDLARSSESPECQTPWFLPWTAAHEEHEPSRRLALELQNLDVFCHVLYP
ncbi:unnamed protein product [Symbiodinium pilosum]|uniref:Uncharacterized protein n=1 Tax=Symbiodinium pilosum TaxID=2952 RepID=A0A812ULP2_SYMPI|nr:unnamed protein product [Symbiodinium pilosum]